MSQVLKLKKIEQVCYHVDIGVYFNVCTKIIYIYNMHTYVYYSYNRHQN
jgi:hypothetical protein